jgi:group I intron endonuclease
MVVYLTINLVNGKKYIGQDSNNNPKYLGSGTDLKKAIKKYGRDNFKKIILENIEDISKLNEKEEFWIKKFKADKSSEFYNISEKGMGFPKGLKSIAQSKSKWKPIHQYDLQGNFIKEWPNSKSATEYYKFPSGTISNVLRGKYKSGGGFIWIFKGKQLCLPNIPRPNHCIEIHQYDLQGNFIKEWPSVKEICNYLKYNKSNLSKHINGKTKQYKGYIWKPKYIQPY